MPLPTLSEAKDHIRAVMDVGYLRTTQHMIQERIRALDADNPIQQKPSVATPATAPKDAPAPAPKSDTPAPKVAPVQPKAADPKPAPKPSLKAKTAKK